MDTDSVSSGTWVLPSRPGRDGGRRAVRIADEEPTVEDVVLADPSLGRTGVAAEEAVRRDAHPGMNTRLPDAGAGLALHVVDTEGDFGVCSGETLGVGFSGLSARLSGPLPCSCETTVHVELPDGRALLAAAVVASGERHRGGWTYRLVFVHLDQTDVEAISSVTSAEPDHPVAGAGPVASAHRPPLEVFPTCAGRVEGAPPVVSSR